MNALPVGPEQTSSSESRGRYFDDLERWGFDIAYNTFYANTYDDVTGRLREAYTGFVAEAHRRGYPAYIQVQSTICAGDRVGIEEAQYDLDNNPDRWGKNGFFASFASDAWRDYLMEITDIFVRRYGYDGVVFGEPMCRKDVPGTKDRFHEKFARAYPDVRYPQRREETTAYLLVQQEKAKTLTRFYTELVDYARSVGAKKVGIVPWFFTPTVENTPEGTLNTSCNIDDIAGIPGLDLVVVRMRPDNVCSGVMRTGDEIEKSPKLCFTEAMAHALGKDVIVVSDSTDELADVPSDPPIPFEFFRDATLASLAAAPNGFTRRWHGQKRDGDDEHTKMLVEAAAVASRLGNPVAPVAFVFSYSGTRHVEPLTCETVFPHYWALAKKLAFDEHLPMLTFHASTLKEDLAAHPEVMVLVFEEHFPLTIDEILPIRDWWEGDARRSVVAFASGLGFSADPKLPDSAPCAQAFPGLMELIGIRQEDAPVVVSEDGINLRDTCRVRRKAFLTKSPLTGLKKIASVRRVFGSRANVLYEADIDGAAIPVVAEYRDRTTLAVFCGFGLSRETADAAANAIRYAMDEAHSPEPLIDSCSDGMLWSANRNDYIILSNLSDKEGHATARLGRGLLWDCRQHKLLTEQEPVLKLPPHSFALYRTLSRRSKFLDVFGASSLHRLTDGAGRAEIEILAGRKTVFALRASPRDIQVDGKSCTITQEVKDGVYYITLQQCPPGEHKVALKW